MARNAWWGVGIGALLLAGGLLSGYWPLTRLGALIGTASVVVVVLATAVRRFSPRPPLPGPSSAPPPR